MCLLYTAVRCAMCKRTYRSVAGGNTNHGVAAQVSPCNFAIPLL